MPAVEAAKPAAPSAVKTTKLKNGVTVASRDAHGSVSIQASGAAMCSRSCNCCRAAVRRLGRAHAKIANEPTISPSFCCGLVFPQTASVGVYGKAGSRYETVPGTAYALEQLAFKTTQQRSTIKLARDMENAGAVVSAKAGREVVSRLR